MIDQRVRKLTPEFATYTISKAGLWALTQTAAQAGAACPGQCDRPRPDRDRHAAVGGAFRRPARRDDPEARLQPREIRVALRFILASPGLTGQLLCVDGGQHLGWKTPDIVGVE